MSYTLLIGDYAYSSWSMRAWLMLDAFGIDFSPNYIPLNTEDFVKMQRENYPACTVPALSFNEGGKKIVVWDTLTIAETLAERHPDAGLWPSTSDARMFARSLSAQMHSGFSAIRDRTCMNLNVRYKGFVPTEQEQQDADRITDLWTWALKEYGGPFLFGKSFTVADAMYAPIATRFVTYGFRLNNHSRNYIELLYSQPSFRRWHACADAQLRIMNQRHYDFLTDDQYSWPRKAVLPAKKYAGSISEAVNDLCPYSGKPIVGDSLAEIDGVIIGFCNQFCCRRGMADAESWPSVMSTMGR